MLQICLCCNSCPEFVELSGVFESLVVLVHHLGVQRLVHTFLIPTLLLLFDSSILRNASLQLAFREHALQRSACLLLLFLQGLLHCPNLFFFNSAVLPVRLESLLLNLSLPCFDAHLLSLKPLAIGHQLFLRNSESLFKLFLCLLGSSSLLSITLQYFNVTSDTFFSVSTLSFSSSMDLCDSSCSRFSMYSWCIPR